MICGFSIFGLSKNVLNHKGIIVWGFFLGGGEGRDSSKNVLEKMWITDTSMQIIQNVCLRLEFFLSKRPFFFFAHFMFFTS